MILIVIFKVTSVKVSPDFKSLNVFWLATAEDIVVDKILKSIAGPIRHELSQLRLMGEVPRVFFVRDRHYSKAAEVDHLLKTADFGEDFQPTDPTLFMKSQLELQMKLPDDVRSKIFEMENSFGEDDYIEEEELPEMRHDVLGLDHQLIMKRIAMNIDKSKKAWENFETRGESIISTTTPSRDFGAAQLAAEKLSKEAELREEFVKFLERKQFSKSASDRKRNRKLNSDDRDDEAEDYRDPIPDGDFIEEDFDVKK